MPTFERCDKSVGEMASSLLRGFESHKPLVAAKVTIDFLYAYADRDNKGNRKNDALVLHGYPALGICKKTSLKDRAKGNGDAEILLDGDWWKEATDEQQRALLDHELHHLFFTGDLDDLDRPILSIRQHDFNFGWFKIIAERHGAASQEQMQAAVMMESSGQYFWPSIRGAISGGSRTAKLELRSAQ